MKFSALVAALLTVLFLLDLYAYQPVKTLVRSLPYRVSEVLKGLYWLIALVGYAGILGFRWIIGSVQTDHERMVLFSLIAGSYIAKVLVCVVTLIDDLRRGLTVLVKWARTQNRYLRTPSEKGISRSQFLSNVAILTGGTLMGILIHGFSNRYNYQVRRVRLRFQNLPPAFRGMKIVQLSDFHTGSFDDPEKVKRGIDMILLEKPDFVFFTGDLVNDKASELLEEYRTMYARIQAPMGVYSTLGNHDYGDYTHWPSADAKLKNLEELKSIEASFGWMMLNNQHVILNRSGQRLAIIGVENWSAFARFKRYGDLKKAYEGVQDIPFKILLSHDPSHWDAEVNKSFPDIDLTLSGHTHGMQFGVEIPGFKWSPIEYLYKEWAGLYKRGTQILYVNRGFGFIGYPGRVGIMPEVTVLQFV